MLGVQQEMRAAGVPLQERVSSGINANIAQASVLLGEHGAALDATAAVGIVTLTGGGGKEAVRIRHYTSNKGINGIEESGVILASDQNKVFAELARGKPLAARDVEATYGLKQGRGRNYVETEVPADRVQRVYNPLTKSHELQIVGDVPLQNATFHRR